MISKRRLRKFSVSKKLVYTLIALFLFLLIGIGVYAMTAGSAPAGGHTMTDSVSAPAGCGADSFLKWTGSNWECISGNIPVCTGDYQGISWTGESWRCTSLS